MRVAMLTKEYPPHVYGGAGVHVEHLSRELARLEDVAVEVRCFGEQRAETPDERLVVRGYEGRPGLRPKPALDALSTGLRMIEGLDGVGVVHTHTWYTALAGFLARKSFGAPHVLTVHSLEPLRPWKADQLGEGGYELSTWMERTAIESADAVVAVSTETRADILRCYPAVRPERIRVIHNGIDPEEFAPRPDPAVLERRGIDPAKPFALFVGRITAQKGADHFVDACARLDRGVQVVLLADAPDTVHYARLLAEKVRALQTLRRGVFWIEEMVPRDELAAFYSQAAVFCCPSIYEPFGIVNLEAMACEAPVVATRVGGIPEVVVEGETGFLAPPSDPPALAERMNALVRDPELGRRMGRAGRTRVLERFTWRAIASRTRELYGELAAARRKAA
ncbi:MAG TPA: glycogen synthase [Planctomycetota bacterium]|nr:glycogen synthase [Planctomycetota bacterium]